MPESNRPVVKLRPYSAQFTPIDPMTGEVGEAQGGIVEMPTKGRGRGRKIVFSMVESDAMTRLQMTQSEWNVFWQIAAKVNRDANNESFIRTTQIAVNLDAHPQNVSRTLRNLRDRNIIISLGPSAWRINAWISWRGEASDWAKADSDPEPIWERA